MSSLLRSLSNFVSIADSDIISSTYFLGRDVDFPNHFKTSVSSATRLRFFVILSRVVCRTSSPLLGGRAYCNPVFRVLCLTSTEFNIQIIFIDSSHKMKFPFPKDFNYQYP